MMCPNNEIVISGLPKRHSLINFNEYFNLQVSIIEINNQDGSLGLKLADKLKKSGLIISKTDTVPGILSPISQRENINKIYHLKKRNPYKKLIILAKDLEMALSYAPEQMISQKLIDFCEKIWPGPATLILPLDSKYSNLFNPPFDPIDFSQKKPNDRKVEKKHLLTYAVRVPSTSWLRKLIEGVKEPIVAPSANISGSPTPPTPKDIFMTFKDSIHLYHFGYHNIAIEKKDNASLEHEKKTSTIIDVTGREITILRKGRTSQEEVYKLWNEVK